MSKLKLPSFIKDIPGNLVDAVISEYASGKISDSLEGDRKDEAKKIDWGRIRNVIIYCMLTCSSLVYLIMLDLMLFEYVLNGKITNIKYDLLLCSKLAIMAGFISGVGCCFLKDE